MSLQSRIRSVRARRTLTLTAGVALLATLAAIPSSDPVLAQAPPPDGVVLVNEGENFVERKKEGRFIARPVFNLKLDTLHYAVRHPDTGEWLAAPFRVTGGEKRLRDGWEYTFEYPGHDSQPDLDPDRSYLLVLLIPEPDRQTFHAVIPVHQPGGLWDRVIGALDPGRWAKAFARWMVEGVHGTLCGVVERASGEAAANCREG